MGKRLFKKMVAALVLTAMLAQTGYEDFSFVVNAYATETSSGEEIEVDVSGVEQDIEAESEDQQIDIEVSTESTDVEEASEDAEISMYSEAADEIPTFKEVYEDKAVISGYDDVTLHVVTGQMNTEDQFSILLTGPSSMEYDSELDSVLDKFSQNTYFIEQLEKAELTIEVEVLDGMSYKFSNMDNGDIQLEIISAEAEEEESEKYLQVLENSIEGSGYDSVTFSFDASALDDDTVYELTIDTEADATYEGALISNSVIPSLTNTINTITINDLNKKAFAISVQGSEKTGVVAEFTVKSEEDGEIDAVLSEIEEEATKRVYTYEDDKVSVTATLEFADAIPDDADFVVTEVTPSSGDYDYDAYMQALNENADAINGEEGNTTYTEDNTLLYDIAFYGYDDDGNYVELQPEEGSVRISIKYKRNQLKDELEAESGDDVTIVHMPLVDSVKESVDSTADATNISSSDIVVDVVASNVSVGGESIEIKVDSFSCYAVLNSNKKFVYIPGTTRTYEEILGSAINYGVTANEIKFDSHCDTNFAAGHLISNAQTTQGQFTGNHNPGDDIIAKYTGTSWWANAYGEKPYVIRTTDTVKKILEKNSNISSRKIYFDTDSTEKELQAEVARMVSGTLSDALKNESSINNDKTYDKYSWMVTGGNDEHTVGWVKAIYSGDPLQKYVLDLTDSPAGTYYFNFSEGEYASYLGQTDKFRISLKSGQNVVFNIPDTNIKLFRPEVIIDGKMWDKNKDGSADKYVRAITWNVYAQDASVIIEDTIGIFLIPNGSAKVGTTSVGWLVCNKMIGNDGEWHGSWQGMPESHPTAARFTIRAKKTVDGHVPSEGETFKFGLYDLYNPETPIKDANGNPLTATSDANGNITFPEIVYEGDFSNGGAYENPNSRTTHINYLIKEIPDQDGKYKYSEEMYVVWVYVHTDERMVNSIENVRIMKKNLGTTGWKGYDANGNLVEGTGSYLKENHTGDWIVFNNETVEKKPDQISIDVKKTFEGNWDADTKVKVKIEPFKMGGIEEVPADIWSQISSTSEVTLTPSNPTGTFGTLTFDADYLNGNNPTYGSPEGTVKYHVYMFKITEDLITDPSVVNDTKADLKPGDAGYLGYTVAQRGVRYLKLFINTVTKDYKVYEAKITAQVKGNTADNTNVDKCQGLNGPIEFINKRSTGEVAIVKKDAVSNATLDGVKFGLFNAGDNSAVKVKLADGVYKYSKAGTTTELITANGGKISIKDLPAGSYYLKETSVPAGYADQTSASFAFTVNGDGSISNKTAVNKTFAFANATSSAPATYTINNTALRGSVSIEKIDAVTKAGLSGVSFDLYKDGSTSIYKILVTDKNGNASASDLEWGSYVMKERSVDGYVPNTKEYSFVINATNLSKAFTGNDKIENTPIAGSFKLYKSADNKPLAGAVFNIKKNNVTLSFVDNGNGSYSYSSIASTTTQNLVTNASGEFEVTNLPAGSYDVIEISTPAGYVLKTANAANFSIVNNGDHKDARVTNDKTSANVKFFKIDEEFTDVKLAGVGFELWGKFAGQTSYSKISEKTSSSTGEVTFEGLGIGSYYVKEVKGLNGYVFNPTSPLTINFDVTDADNGKTIYLNNEGRVDSAAKANVTNKRENGSVTIKKVSDKGTPLSGVEFALYEVKNGNAKEVISTYENGAYKFSRTAVLGGNSYTTDDAGEITVTNLPWGSYYFVEIGVGSNNVVISKNADGSDIHYSFDISGSKLVDLRYQTTPITNDTIEGYVRIVKIDAEDSDNKLKGAKFNLYKADKTTLATVNGVAQENLTTGDNGEIVVGPLEYGTYYFKETQSVPGYEIQKNDDGSDKYYEVKVNKKGTANTIAEEATKVASNDRKLGSISLTKTDATTKAPLAGAKFELWSTNNRGLAKAFASLFNGGWSKYGEYTTGEDGTITVNNLPWGKYKFIEVEAPAGYEKPTNVETPECTIGVNAESAELTHSYAVVNNQRNGSIKLVKTDAADSSVKLSGGEFRLYNGLNEEVDANVTYRLTNGEVVVEGLPFGSYYFVETKAPEGYVTPSGDAAKSSVATIDAETVSASVDAPIVANLSNGKITGGFELTKVDGNGASLAGATFSVWKNYNASSKAYSDQVSANGTSGAYTFSTAGSASVLATDANGKLKVTGLPYGTYYVKEETAPAGYVLATDPVEVNVAEQDQIYEFNFVNSIVKAKVKFAKADKDTKEKLSGATFELFKASGSDEAATSLGAITETSGVYEKTDLGVGNYYIIETSAPNGYKKSEKRYTFTVTAADDGQYVALENADGTDAAASIQLVFDEKLLGKAKIKKVGSDTNNGLAGAEFNVCRKSNNQVINATPLVSGEDGWVSIEDLSWDTYYFVETKAPEGYDINNTHFEFTIDADNTDVTLAQTVVDTYILGSAELYKYAKDVKNKKTDKKLDGAVFDLYIDDQDGNFSNDVKVQDYASGLTTEDGKVTATNLPAGSYYFLERVAPKGYELSTERYSFTISASNYKETISLKNADTAAYNSPKLGKAKLFKYETKNGEKIGLAGVKFDLFIKRSHVFGLINTPEKVNADDNPYISDASGIVSAEGLEWGDYYFVEHETPTGYAPNNDKVEFTIDENCQNFEYASGSATEYALSLENTPILGAIKLVKSDRASASKLSGAKFELHKLVGSTDTVLGDFVTDAKGEITVDNLEWAQYYFVEVEAPTGYVTPVGKDARTETVTVDANSCNEVISIDAQNDYAYGNVQITKIDSDNNVLKGAQFELYDYTNKVKGARIYVSGSDGVYEYSETATETVMETPESGVIKVTGLPYGTYAFLETVAPTGFVKSSEYYEVSVTANQSKADEALDAGKIVCINTTLRASALLYKFWKINALDTAKALEGATFNLYKFGVDGPVMTSTSDSDGLVTFNGLGEGTYVVREASTPNDAYELLTGDLYTFTVTHDDDGKVFELNSADSPLINTPKKGSAKLTKYYREGGVVGNVLKGVTFNLYKGTKDGATITYGTNPILSKVTNDLGVVEFDNLEWGYYEIREDKTNLPAGIVGTDETWPFVIDEETLSNAREYVAYNDRESGSLVVDKVDSATGAAISNVKFELTGPVNATLVTDENGHISKNNLPWGYYVLEEVETAEGYVLGGTQPVKWTFTIDGANLSKEFTGGEAIKNDKIKGNVEFDKIDSKTKKPMKNVIFKLFNDDTNTLYVDETHPDGLFMTDEDGHLSINGLEYGSYHFKEETPDGYDALTESQMKDLEFKITENGKTVTLKFKGEQKIINTPKDGKVKITKVITGTNTPIEGAVFTLYGSDPETFGQTISTLFSKDNYYRVGTYTTLADGTITVEGLPWQKYFFVEQDEKGNSGVPAGYAGDPNKKYEFEINQGNCVHEISWSENVENSQLKGAAKLIKIDPAKVVNGSAKRLEGAKFSLYKKTLDANGQDTYDNITASLTEAANGVKPVGGYLVTNGTGEINVSGLEWGDYYFVEEVAPEGYDLVLEDGKAKKYSFSINASNYDATQEMMTPQQVTVSNNEIYGYISIQKRLKDESGAVVDTANSDLSGIEFVVLKSDQKTNALGDGVSVITDASGKVAASEIGALPFGTYYIKEISVPAKLGSYPVNDGLVEVNISEANTVDDASEYFFDNSEVLGAAKLTKIDATSKRGIAGVQFDLHNDDATGSLIETITADENGVIKKEGLALGDYYFQENQESVESLGYVYDDTKYTFSIEKGDGQTKITGENNVVTLQWNYKDLGTVENTRRLGSLQLKKYGKDANGNSKQILLNADSEARFELYRVGVNGAADELVKTKDEIKALYNESGVVTVENLAWGKYYFKEIVPPNGYQLPANPDTEIVDVDGSVVASASVPLASITDDTIKVYISKVEVGGSQELPNASMQIYKKQEGSRLGTVSTYGEKVYEWTSGSTSKLIEIGSDFAEGLIPGVTYILHEDSAPAGYSVANDFEFVVDNRGQVTTDARARKSESGVWTIFVEDSLIDVYIEKMALNTAKSLPGATLTVKHGEEVVDSWISTGEAHKVSQNKVKLVVGEQYVLEETSAPVGYYTAEPITFRVLPDGRVAIVSDASAKAEVLDTYNTVTDSHGNTSKVFAGTKLTMFDKPIKLVISKTRLGAKTDYIEGAKLSIYPVDGAKKVTGAAVYSWVSKADDVATAINEAEEEIPYGKLMVGGTYVIKEDASDVPAGYIVADDVYFTVDDYDPTKVTDDEQLLPQKEIVEDGLVVAKFSKKNLADKGKEVAPELEGALLQLYDSSNNLIKEWTSSDKPFVVTAVESADSLTDSEKKMYEGYNVLYGVDLKVGKKYRLVEKTAPYGFATADDIEFTIGENGLPEGADVSAGVVTMWDGRDESQYTHVDVEKRWLLYRDEKGNVVPGKTYADVTIKLTQSVDGKAPNTDIDIDGDGKGDGEITKTIKNGASESFVLGQDENGKDILPKKNREGKDYFYAVTEVGDGTYEPIINGAKLNYIIFNRPVHDPFKISGKKVWDDYKGAKRPDITIELWQDGKLFDTTKLSSDLTFEFDNLWEYNFGLGKGEDLSTADGHKFVYEVKEVGSAGYTLKVDMNGTTVEVNPTTAGYRVPAPGEKGEVAVILTNKIIPEYVQIRGNKFWNDEGNSAARPDVTVNLYKQDSTGAKVLVDTYIIPKTSTTYSFGTAGREPLLKYDEEGELIKYTVEEVVPKGYDTPVYKETEFGVDITNTPSKVIVRKRDASTGTELAGALLAIEDSTGKEVERWRSRSTSHYIEGLTIGERYTLRELEAPSGYDIADPVSFTVSMTSDGRPQEIVMDDPRIVGSVTLTKRDSATRDTLSGAVFNLYTSSGATVNVVGSSDSYEYYDGSATTSLTVGSSGTLTVNKLPYGEYYFREVTAPAGYDLSTEALYFTVSSSSSSVSVDFLNTKSTGRARLTKTSSADGSALAGATFQLYSKTPRSAGLAIAGTLYSDVYYLYGTYVSDASGNISVSDLPWDDYYFIETEAPEGYVLNEDVTGDPLVYVFTVDSTTTREFSIDLGSITNTPGGGGGGGGATGGGAGGGVAGVRSLKGGVVSGVLGVRAKPTSGVLGVRVGPTTGDAANIALWLVLLLASISVIVAICIQAGKKKRTAKR